MERTSGYDFGKTPGSWHDGRAQNITFVGTAARRDIPHHLFASTYLRLFLSDFVYFYIKKPIDRFNFSDSSRAS